MESTTITFDLRAEGNHTILSFAHRGFEKGDEGYARVTTGWAYYLVSLQQYLETGTGGPGLSRTWGCEV
jgi:Activator of Hsp90 ATPase homolog 1-like protein